MAFYPGTTGGSSGGGVVALAVERIEREENGITVHYSDGTEEFLDIPNIIGANINPVTSIQSTASGVRAIYADNTGTTIPFTATKLTASAKAEFEFNPTLQRCYQDFEMRNDGTLRFTRVNGAEVDSKTVFYHSIQFDPSTGMLTFTNSYNGAKSLDIGTYVREVIEELKAME